VRGVRRDGVRMYPFAPLYQLHTVPTRNSERAVMIDLRLLIWRFQNLHDRRPPYSAPLAQLDRENPGRSPNRAANKAKSDALAGTKICRSSTRGREDADAGRRIRGNT
jgi:hypothetical protein